MFIIIYDRITSFSCKRFQIYTKSYLINAMMNKISYMDLQEASNSHVELSIDHESIIFVVN